MTLGQKYWNRKALGLPTGILKFGKNKAPLLDISSKFLGPLSTTQFPWSHMQAFSWNHHALGEVFLSGFLSLAKSASCSQWKFNAKTHFREINFYRDSKLGAGGMVQFYALLLWRVCLNWFNNVHIIENNKTVINTNFFNLKKKKKPESPPPPKPLPTCLGNCALSSGHVVTRLHVKTDYTSA